MDYSIKEYSRLRDNESHVSFVKAITDKLTEQFKKGDATHVRIFPFKKMIKVKLGERLSAHKYI